MVSEKGDIPDRSEVEPDNNNLGVFLKELVDDRGETIVTLESGSVYELHGYDTHFFIHPTDGSPSIVYTQNDDEDEVWFVAEKVVSFEQH